MDMNDMYRYAIDHRLTFPWNNMCFVGDLAYLNTAELDYIYTKLVNEAEDVAKSVNGEPERATQKREIKMAILKDMIEGRKRDAEKDEADREKEILRCKLLTELKSREMKNIEDMSNDEIKAALEAMDKED